MNKEKQKSSNNNKIQKRPISILLVSLLGGLFLILLLIVSLSSSGKTIVSSISAIFIPFSLVFLIIFFVLIFINRGKNTKRMVGFTIATFITLAIFISAIVLSVVSIDHFSKANRYFEDKQYGMAIANYEIVIKENKDLGQVTYSIQKVEEAEDFLKEANMYIAKGDIYFRDDQFEEALAEYEKAKEICPYLSGLNKKISNANQGKNKQEAAEADKKEKISSALEEGENLYQNKEYEKSLEKFNEVLEIDSKNKEANEKVQEIENVLSEVKAIIASGDSLFEDKQFEEALDKYQDAESLYPYHSEIESKISQCESALKEEKELEKEIEEPPEEEIVQESEIKFSFDEYIDPSKVREYKMIEEEDIKIKALGDKLFSKYTTEEFDKLPINYRLKCLITIPRDITEEELESTFAQIIKDKSTENIEIDEIYVAAWYFEESVGKTMAMGRAEWCPNGKWEELPPEIAESDIRDSYKIVFYIEIQEYEDELKYGLTESERMQAFYDLVVLQDSIPYDDPEWDEKNDESYEIIAEKYGITRSQMFAIGVEGITKGWPMPDFTY